MRTGIIPGLAVAATLLLPSVSQAQTAGSAPLETWLGEVRLLRQAIDRQSSLSARAQLLIGRLALQDQRVARSQATADGLDREVAGAASHAAQVNSELVESQRAAEEATDEARRAQLEDVVRSLKRRLADDSAAASELQTRQAHAKQALEAERARYDELESLFGRMEQELGKPSR